jgi:15-cis-phytoene synthase
MDEASHCLDLVRAHDRDRFLSSLFAPDDKRSALLALYAFDIEVSRIAGAVSEPMLGEIRLQWWREALQALAAGETVAHPVAAALGRAMRDWRLPVVPFVDLVTAHEADLNDDRMTDAAALEAYLGQTSSTVIQLASIALAGEAARANAEAAGLAGVAFGLARLCRRGMQGDARVWRRLPPDLDGADVAALARRRLAEARALAGSVSSAALPAFLPVALTDLYLTGRYSPLRRQLRLWWMARRNRY